MTAAQQGYPNPNPNPSPSPSPSPSPDPNPSPSPSPDQAMEARLDEMEAAVRLAREESGEARDEA